MDAELRKYILDHCRYLMTEEEQQALRRLAWVETPSWLLKPRSQAEIFKVEKLYGLTNKATNDLIALGREGAESKIAERIYHEHQKEIINPCPKCGRLARTPTAKQCRHCGHDWH